MCFSTPKPKPVEMPPKTQAMKKPSEDEIDAATRRQTDRMRGAQPSIMTSGSGVQTRAPTTAQPTGGGKTALGQ